MYTAELSPKGFEMTKNDTDKLFAPVLEYIKCHPSVYQAITTSETWEKTSHKPGDPVPWEETHPDREISTQNVGSLSKYPTASAMATDKGKQWVAEGFLNVLDALPTQIHGMQMGIDFEKGQAGVSPDAAKWFEETSVNQIVRDTTGILLVLYTVPSLPQLPPSVHLLAGLWDRLQNYVVTSTDDPLYKMCSAGAAGDHNQAMACFKTFNDRLPLYQQQLDRARELLWQYFPNRDPDGKPYSGSNVWLTLLSDWLCF